jgi:hypothetical protein
MSTTTATAPLQSAPLDVNDVDEYLCQLLLPRILLMFKYFPNIKLSKDILLSVVQALMLSASLGQTPATRALGLKLQHGGKRRIAILVVCSVIVPTIYRRIKIWNETSSPSTAVEESTSDVERIGFQRRRDIAKRIVDMVERYLPPIHLALLLSWWTSKTPHTLPLLVSGLSYISVTAPQHLNVVYAHRRWLYEELIKCLRAVSPSWQDFTRILVWPRKRQAFVGSTATCPTCQTTPITIPYITNCQHTYCYTCLWNLKGNCRVCRQPVTNRTRV